MVVIFNFILVLGSSLQLLPQVQGKPFDLLQNNENKICETEGCKKTAERLLNSLNRSVNPCDDFYEYSCGNWIKNNPRPPTSSKWSQFSIVAKHLNDHIQEILTAPIEKDDVRALSLAKKFYGTCVDIDKLNSQGLTSIKKIIKDYGGFPLLEGGNWSESNFKMLEVIGRLRRNFGMGLLTDISVRPDMKNTERRVVYFDQPEFFLPRDILLNPNKFASRHQAYKKFMVDAITELDGGKIDQDYLNLKINQVIQFEIKLANISATGEERRMIKDIYNPFTLREIQNLHKASSNDSLFDFNWKSMLDQVFTAEEIQENERIIVLSVKYFKNLAPLLNETSLETIANYVQWRVMASLLEHTTNRMRSIHFDFIKVMTGLKEPEKREVKCSNVDMSGQYYNLGYAVGVKYIDKYFTSEAKDNVNALVGYLRAAFEQFLKEADWMDQETKEKAQLKIKTMSQFIGYPDWMKNATAVDDYFQELQVEPDNHFQNHLNFLSWETLKGLENLRAPIQRDEMDSHPVYVNAMYTPEMNSITFPAGILAPPFFSPDSPASINFGGIGVVIGHEVTHGFDDEGSQYDAKGNTENWWSPSIKEKFNEKAQCMKDQYSQFKTAHGNVNGALTSGENIADNGGLRQSFLGYQNWLQNNKKELPLPGLEDLTSEQLFFLGYSTIWCNNISPEVEQNQLLNDVHSPGKFRVWGAIQNSEKFGAAFNCPVNSPMNPSQKCKLW